MKERLQRLLDSVDEYQQRHTWIGLPFAVVKKFGEDQAGNLAALIAYYAFFSIFPLLLVLVTVLGFVLAGNPQLQQQVLGSALNQFPIIGGRVGSQVHGLHGSWFALIVGVVVALWSGLRIANSAQTAFNTVYEVPRVHRPSIVWRTLRSILLLFVLGVFLIFSTLLSGLSTGGASYGLGFLGPGLRIVAALLALAANTFVFALAFRVLTVKDVSFRDVLPGAILAAVCWQILQLVGGYYIAHTLKGANQTYGTFAVVIGLLSWFYLQAQITLLAAELNVVLRQRMWPRALVDAPKTEADRRAYEAYADTQRFKEPERVDTSFHDKEPESSGR